MRTVPAVRRPDPTEPRLLQAIADAEDLLGADRISQVGVCILDDVVHTWGDCPYAPSIDGVLPWPGAQVESRSLRELISVEQCNACAAGLRRNGTTWAWLLRQLDPAVATADCSRGRVRRGEALRRCSPTGLLPETQIALLLPRLAGEALEAGRMYLVERGRAPAALEGPLERGIHSPQGLSLIADSDGSVGRLVAGHHWIRHIGTAAEADAGRMREVGRICLKLGGGGRFGEELWDVAATVLSGSR